MALRAVVGFQLSVEGHFTSKERSGMTERETEREDHSASTEHQRDD
jgi:hypothetical protein